jgi:hypothetical protein
VTPPFTALPVATTHLPSRRPPPAASEVELATSDPRVNGRNLADGQVRECTVREASGRRMGRV